MRSFLKRLNYQGFATIFLITGMGAMTRTQDATIIKSLQVWALLGIPISFGFLFIGMKDKTHNQDTKKNKP